MATVHRASMTAAVIVCFLGTQLSGTLFASEAGSSSAVPVSRLPTDAASDVQVPVSFGLAYAAAIGGPSVETTSVETTDVSSGSGLESGHARLPFDALSVDEVLGTVAPRGQRALELAPAGFDRFGAQVYQGPPYPYRRRHDASIAAIMIGAAAAIAGTAVLVYANRPECATDRIAGGCGYGTKVIGTAVLSGGIVGLFVGALTWR
jgi:hypothetical protein